MKIWNKRLSAAIAIIMTLAITATLVTATFAQVAQTEAIITHTFLTWVGSSDDNTVGVGQAVLIQGLLTPPADEDINHKFTIEAPNGTQITMDVPTFDPLGGMESHFYFTPDTNGTWRVRFSWAGNAKHRGGQSSWQSFQVTEAAADLPGKFPVDARACTVPKAKAATGDLIFVLGWLSPAREMTGAVYWNFTFTITKPDGTSTTVRIKNSDSPATVNTKFTASTPGTYTVKLNYDGDLLHEAAESPVWTLTVEDGYVGPTITQEPLPTGAWRFPINSENYEWYQISGAWPYNDAGVGTATYDAAGSAWNPLTKAPNTPHVMWKKQLGRSGLTGGDQGWLGTSGSMPRPVAAQGRMYWMDTTRGRNMTSGEQLETHPVIVCTDQFTGEEIYRKELPGVGNPGKIYFEIKTLEGEVDPRQVRRDPAAFSLWITVGYNQQGGTWEVDPWTGECTYYNAAITGWIPYKGYLYVNGYNGTANKNQNGVATKWDCRNKQTIWVKPMTGISNIWDDGGDGIIVHRVQSTGGIPTTLKINTYNANTGELIVIGPESGVYAAAGGNTVGYGKILRLGYDLRVVALDLLTGKIAWQSPVLDAPWSSFGMYWCAAGYNKFYVGSYAGYLYALNADTGAIEWKYYFGDTIYNAEGNYLPWGGLCIADNKVYVATSEHSPAYPQILGQKLYCLDANTGAYIWSISQEGDKGCNGVSSGMLWAWDRLDGCLYMFGKTPSGVTVSAPQTTVPLGTGVLLQGTVTDQGPGTTCFGTPAAGTPAIADASQADWMEYLYKQKSMPSNATGVSVLLQAMLSDGSVVDIGRATSDVMGHYELVWTPSEKDTYKILATFEGSESYYASSAQAALSVGPAAVEPEAPQAAPDNTPYVIGMGVAIIAAIAVVGLLLFRKRP